MTIKFYKNYSENKVVSKNIEQVGSDVTGTFREDVSVTDPVFVIEDYTDFNPATVNYCYIADLGRYYYITDIRLINKSVYEIHCHVDVLKTYAAGIRSSSAIIARQQTQGSLYYQDGVFKTKAYSKYDIIQFPTGFTDYHYVLTVAGD